MQTMHPLESQNTLGTFHTGYFSILTSSFRSSCNLLYHQASFGSEGSRGWGGGGGGRGGDGEGEGGREEVSSLSNRRKQGHALFSATLGVLLFAAS